MQTHVHTTCPECETVHAVHRDIVGDPDWQVCDACVFEAAADAWEQLNRPDLALRYSTLAYRAQQRAG